MTEAYEELEWAILHKGKGQLSESIQRKVQILNEIYNMSSVDLLHNIFVDFMSKKHFEKYNPSKGKLSTFMAHYANYSLLNLMRKQQRLNGGCREVSLPSEVEDLLNGMEQDSLSPLQHKLLLERLSEGNTPEDYFIEKELLEMMEGHFGEDDVLVLLGQNDRKKESCRKGIEYETYRKRLYRKKVVFQTMLTEIDYV